MYKKQTDKLMSNPVKLIMNSLSYWKDHTTNDYIWTGYVDYC